MIMTKEYSYTIEGEYLYPDDFFGAIHYEELYEILGRLSVNELDCIKEQFLNFPIGTSRLEILHWIEDSFNLF